MKFTLAKVKEFVITARTEKNDEFYIRPKNDSESTISSIEGFYPKKEIIEMMNEGYEFYTHYKDSFTEVYESEGNIKSVPNETTEDNIDSLPIV